MINLNLYDAKVIDNNDPTRKGRVKVKVLPEMKGVTDDLLPWVKPFAGVGSSTEYALDLPAIGSKVYVFSNDTFQTNTFYLFPSSIEGFFDFDAVKATIDGALSGAGNYPDMSFTLHASGNVIFENKTTGAYGVVHTSGAFSGMDASGNIISKNSTGDSSVEIKENGNLEVKGTDITVEGTAISVKGQVTLEAGSSIDTGLTSTCVPSAGGVGGFLGIPNCLFTSAPIRGNKITN